MAPELHLQSVIPACFKPIQVELLQPPASALLPTAASRSRSCVDAGIRASLQPAAASRSPGSLTAILGYFSTCSAPQSNSVCDFTSTTTDIKGGEGVRGGTGLVLLGLIGCGTALVTLHSGLLECVIPQRFDYIFKLAKAYLQNCFLKSTKVKNLILNNKYIKIVNSDKLMPCTECEARRHFALSRV